MDIGQSIQFITADPHWVRKVLVGGLIALVSIPLSIVLVGLLGFCILVGYYQEVTRRVYAGSETPLPEWDDFGGYLSQGFFVLVGQFVWYLPLLALSAPIEYLRYTSNASDASGALGVLASLLLLPLQLGLGVLVLPIVAARYAVDGRFTAMFEVDEIIVEIRRAVVPLLILAGITLVASFVAMFGLLACCVGVVFTYHAALLVSAHLRGQAYRAARGLGPGRPATTF